MAPNTVPVAPDDALAAPALAAEPSVAASEAAAKVIAWVAATHDNGDLPFIVVDKKNAELFVFDPSGAPLGKSAVLVGIAKGDDSAPGVGDRELNSIPVAERTTPAGRFVAKFGPALGHKEQILWVDVRDSISLHPVITSNPKEHRQARMNSGTAADNRITYGCINVPAKAYNSVIAPLFRPAGGVVYVLPESKSLHEFFAGIPDDTPQGGPPFAEAFSGFAQQ